jgi:hypothetical protein
MRRREPLDAGASFGGSSGASDGRSGEARQTGEEDELTAKLQPPTANLEPESRIALFNIIVTNG